MNRQLTINHICAYYPYGLEVLHTSWDSQGNKIEQISKVEAVSDECISFYRGCDYYFIDPEPDCEIKLLLYPLSSLTKEITHKGETFVPIEKIKELGLGSLPRSLDYKWLYYHQIEKLFEWHFDIFNLGENNLCIYYGDLNK